ncbi:MAG: hypothetical protein VX028_01660 [Nanoarchaeota archaeon]|nr:hypothetical protein [Nanoarchaeota archaeon]
MYILVKYSSNYEDISKECKNKNQTPIPLFSLTLTKQKDQNKQHISKLKQLVNSKNFEYSALQITLNAIDNTTQGIINQLKQEFDIIIGQGGLNKVNRFFLEQTQIDFLLDPHTSRFKVKFDFIHHFNSGLNHVLCKFAKEKNIGIIHSLNFMKQQGVILTKDIARMNQNTRFARKYTISMYSNFIIAKKEDIISLIQLTSFQKELGMDTKQIKESQTILEKKIKKNKHKKSQEYISKGLEKI